MNFNPSAHKLSNGLTVLLDPMDIATTCMKLSCGVGSRDEKPSEYGITHFMEHMLMKGTRRFPSSKAIDDYIECNSGNVEAHVNNQRMEIYGRILAENSCVLVDLIGDLLKNSLFDQKTLDNERKVIWDEYRRKSRDAERGFDLFTLHNLFRGAGLGRHNFGTWENVSAFTREQMIDYMQRHISATNTVIGVSGKIEDKAALLDRMESLFSWIPSFEAPDNSAASIHPGVFHNPVPEGKNVSLKICFEDTRPATLENIFSIRCRARFNMALKRRLTEYARHQNGLTYDISTSKYGNEKVSVNSIITETSPGEIEEMVAVIAQTCKDIMGLNPFNQSELDRTKAIMKLNDATWLENSGSRCDMLINVWRQHGVLYSFQKDEEMRNRITVPDVLEHSRGVFAPEVSIVTQGPEFSADLKKVWEKNFQDDKGPVSVKMLAAGGGKKDNGMLCRRLEGMHDSIKELLESRFPQNRKTVG